jgi:hypothetical protein
MCLVPCVWLFAVARAGCKTTMEELVKEKNSLRIAVGGTRFVDFLDFQFPTTENLLAK